MRIGAARAGRHGGLLLLLLGLLSAQLGGSRFHRQPQPALLVGLEDLDLDRLAFLQVIADLIDALAGDLRDVEQAVAAGQDLHDRAEVQQPQHGAVVDLADLDLGTVLPELDAITQLLAPPATVIPTVRVELPELKRYDEVLGGRP